MRLPRQSLDLVRTSYGSLQIAAPDLLATRLLGAPLTPAERRTARVLGMRHVLQAATTRGLPSPTAYRIGAGVDGLHALSMVALAVADPGRRRIAVAEAISATTFTLAGLGVARLLAAHGLAAHGLAAHGLAAGPGARRRGRRERRGRRR